MKARDDLLEQLKKESLEKLSKYCQGAEYPEFLRKLIVQGLIKIQESTVVIQVRAEDKALVTRVVSYCVELTFSSKL